MRWFPIGPDFVFVPRRPDFERISRRNELGRQGLVKCIATDPADPAVIYVVERPSSGGAAAFRTDDAGASWTCITDVLFQQTGRPGLDPIWIGVNPQHPDTVYLATHYDTGLYVSPDRGQTWGPRKPVPGRVHTAVVDARYAGSLPDTHLVTATTNGVLFSDNAGDTWTLVVAGEALSVVGHTPPTGTAHFYAGVKKVGLHYATDPAGPWTNLNSLSVGMPAYSAGDGTTTADAFHHILVGLCPQWPTRAYAWFARPGQPSNDAPYVTEGLYTTDAPTVAWTRVEPPQTTIPGAVTAATTPQVVTPVSMTGIGPGIVVSVGAGAAAEDVFVVARTATSFTATFAQDHPAGSTVRLRHPDPAQGWYNYVFAVAPNSPGNGTDDVLFFGRIELYRSTDGGRTWVMEAWQYANPSHGNGFHADQQSFAFIPADPVPGTIPDLLVGCDGGIARSTRYCDPTFDVGAVLEDFSEGPSVTPNGLPQNLNHGRQCSALFQYASHSAVSALSYIGCQDTGVNGGAKSLGWRGLADADGGPIAVAPGKDGVRVWGNLGSPFYMMMWTDDGSFTPRWREVTLESLAGPHVKTTSDYETSANDQCITGMYVFHPRATIPAVTHSTTAQVVTPSDMSEIGIGSVLTIGEGADLEFVTVTAVTATTFTAVFTLDHIAGSRLMVNRTFVARVDHDGVAWPISQDFTTRAFPGEQIVAMIVRPDPGDPDRVVVAAGRSGHRYDRVFLTTTASTANGATQWFEVTDDKPPDADVRALAITPSHTTHVLLKEPVTVTTPAGVSVTTPLFRLTEGGWVAEPCTGNPTNGDGATYGALVAHPTREDRMFASHGGRVFELRSPTWGTWTWKDVSDGLPGSWIYDLWIGFYSQDRDEAHVVLRAGAPTRGIWEYLPALGGDVPQAQVYLRHHLLDQGLLTPSEGGLADPFDPKHRLWHYLSPDVKLDVQRPATAQAAAHFQTDPEASVPPISHVHFNQLVDYSVAAPAGTAAWVHAQVHNRSHAPVHNVQAWAIWCHAAAGLPSLAASPSHGNAFDFWSQFTSTGAIVPALPPDSPWTAVGPPVTLGGLDAAHPQIASWPWAVPASPLGGLGHACIVVFVHGGACPIAETGLNVDAIASTNRQVAQKNLHLGAPLAAGGPGSGAAPTRGGRMTEYVELHNPDPEPRRFDLVVDLTGLPRAVSVTMQLTELTTRRPLEASLEGVATSRPPDDEEVLARLDALGPGASAVGERFTRTVHELVPGAVVRVRDVVLSPMSSAAALLRVRNAGELRVGSRYRFDMRQESDERTLGGSAYVIVVEGIPERPPRAGFPFEMAGEDPREWDVIERDSQFDKYVPPWAVEIVRTRRAELDK